MVEMFIDPGLITGWAAFTNGRYCGESGTISSTRIDDLHSDKANYILDRFEKLINTQELGSFYIEGVDMRGGRGNYSAIMRGDLTRLAYLVGALQARAAQRADAYIVSPLWKGNLSKDAMRVQLKLMEPGIDTTVIKNHEADAVAMGVFKYKNRWIKNWRIG